MNHPIIYLMCSLSFSTGLAQSLVQVEQVELSLAPNTELYVQGGITWKEEGYLLNEGKLLLGSSENTFIPQNADWYQAGGSNAGLRPESNGPVSFIGAHEAHRIWGVDSIYFPALFITYETMAMAVLATKKLELQGAILSLGAFKLHLLNAQPQAIRSLNSGGIYSDSFPNLQGAYTRVIWHLEENSPEEEYVIPFISQNGRAIPMSFSVQEASDDPVEVFTYPTESNNTPYPTQLETIGDVDHLFNALGEDFSPFFIDRFWSLQAGANVLSGLSLSYDPEDISEGVIGRTSELKGQWWNGGKWTYFNLGDPTADQTISWNSSFTFSGIWSLSLDQLTVSKQGELAVKQLSVYPNPTQDMCFIKIELPQASEVCFSLVNSSGQKVWQKCPPISKKYYSIPMNMSPFSRGMYELHILSQGKRISRKILRY